MNIDSVFKALINIFIRKTVQLGYVDSLEKYTVEVAANSLTLIFSTITLPTPAEYFSHH